MSRDACLFAANRWLDIAEERLDHPLPEVEMRSVEFNKDYVGLRLDGSLGCMTRQGLLGVVERLYQKGHSVRHEMKISQPMSLTMFEALLDERSILGYELHQIVYELSENVRKTNEVLKHINAKVGAIFECILRDKRRLEGRKLVQAGS